MKPREAGFSSNIILIIIRYLIQNKYVHCLYILILGFCILLPNILGLLSARNLITKLQIKTTI